MAWPFSKGHLPQHRLRHSSPWFTLSAYTFLGWLFLAPTVSLASSLVDITPGGSYKEITLLTTLKGKAYFKFLNANNDEISLLEYDGNNFSDITSKLGGTLISDLYSSSLTYLTTFQENAYFKGNFVSGSDSSEYKVVKFDGNTFVEVSSENDYIDDIDNSIEFNGNLYIDVGNGHIWEYNGNTGVDKTPEGVELGGLFVLNGKIYSWSRDDTNGTTIYEYNGGTFTKTTYTYTSDHNSSDGGLSYLTTFNNKVFLRFYGIKNRLWEYDGNTIIDITPNGYSFYGGYGGLNPVTMPNNGTYFGLTEIATDKDKLWKHDGNTFTDITPQGYYLSSVFTPTTPSNGKMYFDFIAKDNDSDKLLLEYDGTTFVDVTPHGYDWDGLDFAVSALNQNLYFGFRVGFEGMAKIVEYNGANYTDITPTDYVGVESTVLGSGRLYRVSVETFNNKAYFSLINSNGTVDLLMTDAAPSLPVAPKVTKLEPIIADLGELVTFKVEGTHLPQGLNFVLTDCLATVELPSRSDAQRLFQCLPSNSAGKKEGVTKTANGELMYTFEVYVWASSIGGTPSTTPTMPTITMPQVISVSPTTITSGTPVTFTLTGANLKSGLEFTLTDCHTTTELAGGMDMQRQFQCTPGGTVGPKTGTVKFNGQVLYNFTVTINTPPVTLLPQVTSVTPTTAVPDSAVVFTVTGSNLTDYLNFVVTDCYVTMELVGGIDKQRQFYCTFSGPEGIKNGFIQDVPGGTLLYNFNVDVTGGKTFKTGTVLDNSYDGEGRQVDVDITVGKSGNVSNLVVNAKVENHGLISNTTLKADGEINGGSLSGTITNEGTLRDFEFLGIVLKGGTLAGKIVNNSRVGGKFVDVTLAPDTKITGGTLEGKIQGDCAKPALLDKVRIKAGSTLNCVKLGKEVKIDKDVVLRPLIESVTPLQAPLKEATIFTVTGQNLPAGMGFTVADCEHSNDELSGGTSTKREFVCIHQGEAGSKTGLVKDKPKGETLYTFEVEVVAPAIHIESISPLVTTIGSPTVFTVKGENLPDGLGFTVGDCEHSNQELEGGTETERQFICTQWGDAGTKTGLVKDQPGGTELKTFEVQAQLLNVPNVFINANAVEFGQGDLVELAVRSLVTNTDLSNDQSYRVYVQLEKPDGTLLYNSQNGFSTEIKPFFEGVIPEIDWNADWLSYQFGSNDPAGTYIASIQLIDQLDQMVARDFVSFSYDPTLPSTVRATQKHKEASAERTGHVRAGNKALFCDLDVQGSLSKDAHPEGLNQSKKASAAVVKYSLALLQMASNFKLSPDEQEVYGAVKGAYNLFKTGESLCNTLKEGQKFVTLIEGYQSNLQNATFTWGIDPVNEEAASALLAIDILKNLYGFNRIPLFEFPDKEIMAGVNTVYKYHDNVAKFSAELSEGNVGVTFEFRQPTNFFGYKKRYSVRLTDISLIPIVTKTEGADLVFLSSMSDIKKNVINITPSDYEVYSHPKTVKTMAFASCCNKIGGMNKNPPLVGLKTGQYMIKMVDEYGDVYREVIYVYKESQNIKVIVNR